MNSSGPFKPMKPQKLHQKHDRDCSVPVFAALTGLTEEEVLADLPNAALGLVTVDEWCEWLESKGFEVNKRDGCPDDIIPCAHLVAHVLEKADDPHWVFRDEDGDVHDPAEGYVPANDERMRTLAFYSIKRLTLTVTWK